MSPQREPAPFFAEPAVAVVIGTAALFLAAFCFRDAYERRGKDRPLAVKLIGV